MKKKNKNAFEKPSWDEFFIAIAVVYASRGSCDRLRTACIFVKNKRIVGAGYNGAVAGMASCDEVGHLMINGHCMRTLHGEDNALENKIRGLECATAYILATPCLRCINKMLQAGVARIVYVGAYDNGPGSEYVEEMCKKKNVSLEQMTADPRQVGKIFSKIFTRLQGPGGIFKNIDLQEELFNKKSAKMEGK